MRLLVYESMRLLVYDITTPLYSHLGNESVRKIDFYGLAIALTKT